MAQTSQINSTLENGLFRLVLNRPEKRNALSVSMMEEICGALDKAQDNDAVRVIIISAEGPVFSSGHDLKELTAARTDADKGRDFFAQTMRLCSTMMQKIVNHRLPVIAAVHGSASAAGCQLVASCDLAVASESASFTTPGVNIGLFCSTPMVALSRSIPAKQAMEMLLTGEPLPAVRAVEYGLVNRAVPLDSVDQTAEELAVRIMSKSSMTLKIGKRAFYEQIHLPLSEAYDYCTQVMVENMLKKDAEEGINAFLEKRKALWQNE